MGLSQSVDVRRRSQTCLAMNLATYLSCHLSALRDGINATRRSLLNSNKFVCPDCGRQIGGRGHVHFGHSYSFAAGYVCVLLATLAGIRLAHFSYVQRTGNTVVC